MQEKYCLAAHTKYLTLTFMRLLSCLVHEPR